MIAVTGAGGQLGQALVRRASGLGIGVLALGRAQLDVTDPARISQVLGAGRFEAVVNCAAYNAVDRAEDCPGEAFAVNAYAPWLLAQQGIPLVHVSTDYVFDGASERPYEATDAPRPLSVYGLSKRSGEEALLESGARGVIVRTAWLYSKREGTRNFFQTIRRLARERPEISVVDDQVGSPTLADDLAEAILLLLRAGAHRRPMSLFHFAGKGSCSRFEFARAIVRSEGLACRVRPVPTDAFPARARRPAHAVLSCSRFERACGAAPRGWLEALESREAWEVL